MEHDAQNDRHFYLRACLMTIMSPLNNYGRIPPVSFLVLVLLFIVAGRTTCQTPANALPSLEAKTRQQLIENIIEELRSNYIAPDKVNGIEASLRARLQA